MNRGQHDDKILQSPSQEFQKYVFLIKIQYIVIIVIVIDQVYSKYRETFNLVKETLVRNTIKNQQ